MRNLILILGFFFFFTNCFKDKDDENNIRPCSSTVIDNQEFINAESDPLEIINIQMSSEGCLKITIRYGGGCTEVFATLVDRGDILETQPPQRNLRFVFVDMDQCEAYIQKDYYFNIENLRVEGSNQVVLNLQDFDTPFLYEY